MSVQEVANGVIGMCREGQNLAAIDKFYAQDIVSVEPVGSPEMPAEMNGIDAIRGKNQWWVENHEVHNAVVEGPYLGENGFTAYFNYDVTHKPSGQRIQMQEMAKYDVKNGKVVREEFFYNSPEA
ncbi:MAG: nuclear transport factor 2 family protein [Gemmatimonadetes bacterium]|nr:nuclear transport factor 2 family protein [Gemmatimonadota bacterium]